jgi:hypothetical protein
VTKVVDNKEFSKELEKRTKASELLAIFTSIGKGL